jgi:hypothetical protein
MSTDAINHSIPDGQQPGVHSSAIGPEPDFRSDSNDTGASNEATQGHQDNQATPDSDYPEQKHAGKSSALRCLICAIEGFDRQSRAWSRVRTEEQRDSCRKYLNISLGYIINYLMLGHHC